MSKNYSEQEILDWLSKRKSKYGTAYTYNTIKSYKNSVMDFTKGNLYKMQDMQELEKYLDKFSTSTALNRVRAISAMLDIINASEELKKKYKKKIEDLIKLKASVNAKPVINNKLDSTYTEWTDLSSRYREILRSIKKKKLKSKKIWTSQDKKEYQIYVIASLYYLIPPRRNVYASMIVVKHNAILDENKNYLVTGKTANAPYTFVFGDYKTKGKYGVKRVIVDKRLRLVLKSWVNHIRPGKIMQKPLLYNLRDNTQMTNHNLTNFIRRNVFLGVGSQTLRRLFDSQEHIVAAKDVLVKGADAMNHSVATAVNTYIPDAK